MTPEQYIEMLDDAHSQIDEQEFQDIDLPEVTKSLALDGFFALVSFSGVLASCFFLLY